MEVLAQENVKDVTEECIYRHDVVQGLCNYLTVHEHYCYHLQVKCVLVLHLISAAFATAALGLMSKHLPYRQDSYHCEHCRRLELHAVVLSLKHTQHGQSTL